MLFEGVGRQVDGVALVSSLRKLQIWEVAICAHPSHLQLCRKQTKAHKQTRTDYELWPHKQTVPKYFMVMITGLQQHRVPLHHLVFWYF